MKSISGKLGIIPGGTGFPLPLLDFDLRERIVRETVLLVAAG